MSRTRLAVLGSPISHSKSPALHRAAYEVLGLPWSYEAIDVSAGALAEFVSRLGPDWRGLSLTMPLKREVLPLLDTVDALVTETGGANTVALTDDGLRGFNTDVHGICEAFRQAGVRALGAVLVLGAGATAASATSAAARLGASTVIVAARDLNRAAHLEELGRRIGVRVTTVPLSDVGLVRSPVDAVMSTLPSDAARGVAVDRVTRASSILFDVAYDPWPSPLAVSWADVDGAVIPGIEMLVNQAIAQVRAFVSGSPDIELENESAVELAMRSSIGLGAVRLLTER